MKKLAILILIILNTACTTTMYVASTSVADTDKQCEIQTHWYYTDYVVGSKVDEVLSVRMGERRPVTYKALAHGIVYMGETKRDIKVIGEADGEVFICGQVEGLNSLKDFEGDRLQLTMHCKAKSSPFSKTKGYLPAKAEPYVLKVSREQIFSFSSKRPKAPLPPKCVPQG